MERLGNSIQDKSILADAFRALGFLKTESGSVDEVRSYYAKAIAIDRELNALDNLARDYHLLGGLLMMNGEVSEGEEFLKQAAELFAKGGDTSGAAAVTGTLGTLYYARHDYEGAESWLERSVGFAIAGKKSDPVALGAWHMLGATYLALNKHDQAAKALAPALKLAQELGDRETEAEIRRQIFANSQQETA